jgi:hypothetical protein
VLYRRGSLHGSLLLLGALAFLLYNAASLAFAVAFNNLFLVYIILLSASFFAFLYALMAIDLPDLPNRFSNHLPRRGSAERGDKLDATFERRRSAAVGRRA